MPIQFVPAGGGDADEWDSLKQENRALAEEIGRLRHRVHELEAELAGEQSVRLYGHR